MCPDCSASPASPWTKQPTRASDYPRLANQGMHQIEVIIGRSRSLGDAGPDGCDRVAYPWVGSPDNRLPTERTRSSSVGSLGG